MTKKLEDFTTGELLLQVMKNENMLVSEDYKELEEKIDIVNEYFFNKAIIEECEEEWNYKTENGVMFRKHIDWEENQWEEMEMNNE